MAGFWHPAAVPNRRHALTAIIVAATAVILGLVAVAFAATAGYRPPPGADQPNLTDWLQGWGSIAAVVAGLGAAGITAALLIHEMREARRAREQASQERAEAAEDRDEARRDRAQLAEERRDAAALHARMVAIVSHTFRNKDDCLVGVNATIANYGAGPILDTQVWLMDRTDASAPEATMIDQVGVIPPNGIHHTTKSINPAVPDVFARTGVPIRQLAIAVQFLDMAGRRWYRVLGEQPVQLFDEPDLRH